MYESKGSALLLIRRSARITKWNIPKLPNKAEKNITLLTTFHKSLFFSITHYSTTSQQNRAYV